mmetsp:Transcript_19792/g.38779  ORF Transcript_19792/g.38779 Transcript_19792/m.38779 type:complete len:240 (-) Transcript_19792:246-965(-)
MRSVAGRPLSTVECHEASIGPLRALRLKFKAASGSSVWSIDPIAEGFRCTLESSGSCVAVQGCCCQLSLLRRSLSKLTMSDDDAWLPSALFALLRVIMAFPSTSSGKTIKLSVLDSCDSKLKLQTSSKVLFLSASWWIILSANSSCLDPCAESKSPDLVFSRATPPLGRCAQSFPVLVRCKFSVAPSLKFEQPVAELPMSDGVELSVFPGGLHNGVKLQPRPQAYQMQCLNALTGLVPR